MSKYKRNKLFNFLKFNIIARNLLSLNDLENVSPEQLEKLSSFLGEKYFSTYKRRLFWKWNQKNYQNDYRYLNKLKNLAKKLDLEFYDFEDDVLYLLQAKVFTKFRNLKSLETFYDHPQLLKIAYFHYKNVCLYRYQKLWVKKIFCSEMAISKNEIVFYNRKKKEVEVINFFFRKDFYKFELNSYGLKFFLKDGRTFLLKYLDNEIIFISLFRVWDKALFGKEQKI